MKQADIIKKMTDKEILLNLYITQCFILVCGFVGGLFLFESWEDFTHLFKWDFHSIIVIGGGSALVIVLFQIVLEKVLPKKMLDDGGINERVFKNRGVVHIFFLAIVISFCEEILFRGIVQTHFGIVPASVLFAIIHVRYLRKFVLFSVAVSLSFYLGWLFLLTSNLLVPIFCHFLIDFILGNILRLRSKENMFPKD